MTAVTYGTRNYNETSYFTLNVAFRANGVRNKRILLASIQVPMHKTLLFPVYKTRVVLEN